jgi:hypothetical protein
MQGKGAKKFAKLPNFTPFFALLLDPQAESCYLFDGPQSRPF